MAKAKAAKTKPPKKPVRPQRPVPETVATIEPRKVGRPSLYSEAFVTRICIEIALGKSLISICSADDMPDRVTVYRWLEEHVEFRNAYARARELQADHYADQIVDLADAAEDANLARLQIDARKWTAAKLRPGRYSERLSERTHRQGRRTDRRSPDHGRHEPARSRPGICPQP